MRIAFFGSSLVSSYWNGTATYYRGILRALHDRGHAIIFYEPDVPDRQQHRDLENPQYASSVVYSATHPSEVLQTLETAARTADLLVKASGIGVFDALMEEAALELRSRQTTVAYWDVDAAATLERVRDDPSDPFCSLIRYYDVIFTYGGGAPVIEGYRALGAKSCFPIYNALDPSTHYPVAPDSRFNANLSFLGNRLPDREERAFEFFFKPAEKHPELRFLLGGNGWEEVASSYSNISCVGHVYTADHNAFNSTPTAVLNVCRDSMARCGFSPPTRVFEAAGAAACLITDAWEGIENFLEPGKECLVANDGDEIEACLQSLTPDRCRDIGNAALKRVMAEHTYWQRALDVEKALNQI